MLGRFGAGEVAHQQSDAVIFRADARRQGCRVIHGNAEPVHAGVDMQRRAAMPLVGRAECVPFRQFDHAADHGPRADVGISRRRARHQPVEHVDRRLRCRRARLARLGQIGDEERFAAGLGQGACDFLDTAAIAVGLDHRGAFRRHGAAPERAPIGFDCREIDGEDAAGLGGGRAGGRSLLERLGQLLAGRSGAIVAQI